MTDPVHNRLHEWNPLNFIWAKKVDPAQAAEEAAAISAATALETADEATAVATAAALSAPAQTQTAAQAAAQAEAAQEAEAASKAAVQKAQGILSLSAINAIYKESVADRPFYNPMKVLGLIYYMFVWLTTKADPNQATIDDYNAKLADVINTTGCRSLTKRERAPDKANVGKVVYSNDKDQKIQASKNGKARDAEKAFYEVFKKRCVQINPEMMNTTDFGIYAHAALNAVEEGMESAAQSGHLPNGSVCENLGTRKVLFPTFAANFGTKVYNDMVHAFSDQSLASMSEKSLEERAEEIHDFYPTVQLEDIIDHMCKVTGQKRGDELAELAKQCTVRGNSPMVQQTAEALKAKYTAKLNASIARRDVLSRVDRDGNLIGLIPENYAQKVQPAKENLRVATNRFNEAFDLAFPYHGQPTSIEQKAKFKFDDESVKRAQAVYHQKEAAHQTVCEEFDMLRAEEQRLSHKIKALRSNLDTDSLIDAAREAVDEKAAFYTSLSKGLRPEEVANFQIIEPDDIPVYGQLVDTTFESGSTEVAESEGDHLLDSLLDGLNH